MSKNKSDTETPKMSKNVSDTQTNSLKTAEINGVIFKFSSPSTIIDNNSNNIVYSKYSSNSDIEFPILTESDNKKYDKYLKDLSDMFKGN